MQTGITYKTLCEEFSMSLGEGALLHHRFAKFDLKPNPKLIEAFAALERSHTYCAILTHSTRCNLDHHLPLIGLDRFFRRNLRITIEDHGHDRLKNNSEYPWLLAKWRTEQVSGEKFDDAQITVFEDTDKNLIVPADMGWKTVFVHHGEPRIKLLPHIHEQVRCISEFLNKMPQRLLPAPPIQKQATPNVDPA